MRDRTHQEAAPGAATPSPAPAPAQALTPGPDAKHAAQEIAIAQAEAPPAPSPDPEGGCTGTGVEDVCGCFERCDAQIHVPGLPPGIRIVEMYSEYSSLPYLQVAAMDKDGAWCLGEILGQMSDDGYTDWAEARVVSVARPEVAGLEVLRIETSYAWFAAIPDEWSDPMFEVGHQEYTTICVHRVEVGWFCPLKGEIGFYDQTPKVAPSEKQLGKISKKRPPVVGTMEVSKEGVATYHDLRFDETTTLDLKVVPTPGGTVAK